ncbi:MAG TPA: hypothetical protein GX527_12425 [Clostridiaceae bacterium]|jgi:putative aldouronate transport system substrate-binding protein|nr:hypothetical protein [Clostridiaceae bacterium]
MKKVLAIILAALMILSVVACSTDKGESKPSVDATTGTDPKGTDEKPVELNIITTLAGDNEKFYDTNVYKEFTKQSGVKLTSTYVDQTKFDLLIAGGDTTDLIACYHAENYKNLASGGLVLRLNDLIDKYGNNLKKPEKDIMWTLLKDKYDNDDGSVYGVVNSIGMQGGNARATNLGTYTIWEYYKEIGAPELNDFGDFVDALEKIVKLHPTNAEGQPIYAFSLYNVENQLYPFYGPLINYGAGFRTYNAYIATKFSDNSLCYMFLDDEGPYWMAAKYMNDAYNRGILDPDSFIQTRADFDTKVDNGQVLSNYYAASREGWEIIPMKGTWMQENLFDIGGNCVCIASTCKDKVAAIKLLDYLHSPEGCRLIYSGIQGEHWDYNDKGEPCFTEETIAHMKAGGDEWLATGVDEYMLYSIAGVARGVKCADGYATALERTKPFFTAGLNENGKDFIKFYSDRDGVDYLYPNEVLYARGVKDGSNLNAAITKSYGTPPDDIARIDAALLEIAINSVPNLVMAAPADFEDVKAKVLADFKSAGVQKSYEYWQSRWKELADKFMD